MHTATEPTCRSYDLQLHVGVFTVIVIVLAQTIRSIRACWYPLTGCSCLLAGVVHVLLDLGIVVRDCLAHRHEPLHGQVDGLADAPDGAHLQLRRVVLLLRTMLDQR